MQSNTRKRLPVDERQQQLITLGKQIFGEYAYDGISTDQIVERAQISKGLLYHYFPSKRLYYLATLEAAAAELLASTHFNPAHSPVENLRITITLFLDFAVSNPLIFKALVRSGIGTDPECNALVDSVRDDLAARLLTLTRVATSPQQHLRLYGWLGLAEFVCIRWLDTHNISRQEAEQTLFTSACWAIFGDTPNGVAA